MNDFLSYLIVLFAAFVLLSLFYWQVIHPVILAAFRFALFARRDELRRMAINGDENVKSFAYQEAESFLCKTICLVPRFSLLPFLWFMLWDRSEMPSSLKRFQSEASPALQRIVSDAVRDSLRIMLLNSPILLISGGIGWAVLWLCGGSGKQKLYQGAENFIDGLPAT